MKVPTSESLPTSTVFSANILLFTSEVKQNGNGFLAFKDKSSKANLALANKLRTPYTTMKSTGFRSAASYSQ